MREIQVQADVEDKWAEPVASRLERSMLVKRRRENQKFPQSWEEKEIKKLFRFRTLPAPKSLTIGSSRAYLSLRDVQVLVGRRRAVEG
jgi:hypothetical protein